MFQYEDNSAIILLVARKHPQEKRHQLVHSSFMVSYNSLMHFRFTSRTIYNISIVFQSDCYNGKAFGAQWNESDVIF
jgi:hypothetical protein